MQLRSTLLVALAPFAACFTIGAPMVHQSMRTVSPTMGVPASLKIAAGVMVPTGAAIFAGARAMQSKKEAAEAAKGRAALAGMSSLSDLKELSIEPAKEECVIIGDWKEYTKSNGKKWYYQISTGKMQWTVPDEFRKEWKATTLAYE